MAKCTRQSQTPSVKKGRVFISHSWVSIASNNCPFCSQLLELLASKVWECIRGLGEGGATGGGGGSAHLPHFFSQCCFWLDQKLGNLDYSYLYQDLVLPFKCTLRPLNCSTSGSLNQTQVEQILTRKTGVG